jgi:hypothetical protein
MKRSLAKSVRSIVLALALILCLGAVAPLTGCSSSTEYGECIGVADEKAPNLNYKVSTWNAVVSIIFVETVFAPVIWLVDDFYCPVSRKVPVTSTVSELPDSSAPALPANAG